MPASLILQTISSLGRILSDRAVPLLISTKVRLFFLRFSAETMLERTQFGEVLSKEQSIFTG